jgi:hypothetical protein
MNKIQGIQVILGVEPDGIWGPKSQAALDAERGKGLIHAVYASSFADPADVRRYKEAKAKGWTDQQAFRVGDNAVGYWGDSTAEGSGPSCALPPEIIKEEWGSLSAGHNKPILVKRGDKEVICLVKDTMPHLANLANAARIDLNPDACEALGLTPPVMTRVTWQKLGVG